MPKCWLSTACHDPAADSPRTKGRQPVMPGGGARRCTSQPFLRREATMAGGTNMQELIKEGLKVPRDARGKKRLAELVERGEFEALDPAAALPGRPRYLVTFMKSVTAF